MVLTNSVAVLPGDTTNILSLPRTGIEDGGISEFRLPTHTYHRFGLIVVLYDD